MNAKDPRKMSVQAQFGQVADAYVASESHSNADALALLVDWVDPQSSWCVLDVATGGGHVARTLAPHVSTVIATDLTKPMLEAARRYMASQSLSNVYFVQADAESIPFLDDTFDVVTCRIAAHHFPNPSLFVEDSARVLKPGGRLLIVDNLSPDDRPSADFMNTFERMRDESHIRCLSLDEWILLLNKHDIHVIKHQVRKKTLNFVEWASRMRLSDDETRRVEDFMCQASPLIQNYFNIRVEDDKIQSFQLDEMMLLGTLKRKL